MFLVFFPQKLWDLTPVLGIPGKTFIVVTLSYTAARVPPCENDSTQIPSDRLPKCVQLISWERGELQQKQLYEVYEHVYMVHVFT